MGNNIHIIININSINYTNTINYSNIHYTNINMNIDMVGPLAAALQSLRRCGRRLCAQQAA